jgi:hypothetical protein
VTRRAAILALVVFASGCGSGDRWAAADVERGRTALAAALDAWKANEPAAKLKTLADPVEFAEELRGTHTLTGYSISEPQAGDPVVIRYPVTLQLKDRKGKATTREAVYAVVPKSPVVVSRDPFY